MSLYINEQTMEYPRYAGDVEREPDAQWALVIETDEPQSENNGMVWVEDIPQKINDQWTRTWKEVSLPPKTRETEILKAKELGIDLNILGIK